MSDLETLELGFSDIRMELLTGKKSVSGGKKVLLDGSVRGVARPGRMLAIMGPSGAGKVSLTSPMFEYCAFLVVENLLMGVNTSQQFCMLLPVG